MINQFYKEYKFELYEVMRGVHPPPLSFPHCARVQKERICMLLKQIKGAKMHKTQNSKKQEKRFSNF